jgi:hypothetical protein
MRVLLLLAAAALSLAANDKLTPEMQAVMDRISAASLRGHLSFIASDLLEGRATPSRGLDLAAEYIAAQFRRAGLEPVGDDGYFQTATLSIREPNWDGFQMTITAGGKTLKIDPGEVYLTPDAALNLNDTPILSVEVNTPITPDLVNGKVVYVSNPRAARGLQGYQPALVLSSARELPTRPNVRDPEAGARGFAMNVIARTDVAELLSGGKEARITVHMAAARERPVKVRNVAGLLRGSDPSLRDTYVMLTAHYDHIGTRATGEDRIFNGANDDGSGTVSVVEIASALGALDPRPKRSILFMTFFGEEIGLVGSRYYGRHPIVPLTKTIADLNLEQVGRTDATNGRQTGTATITGFDFSDVAKVLLEAGQLAGIKIYKDNDSSDPYFARSDNQALADVGVPAHTLCVAFAYSDYHGVGDHWEKIDYDNMAKVDRAVALGLLHMASEAHPPRWNESDPGAKKYVEAEKKLHH